ncbi:MAG TPA: hypothetical protein PKC21_07500 [Oligoflexia bacterium]|nr:hypothetical protein [Oligoflexia bacterium]
MILKQIFGLSNSASLDGSVKIYSPNTNADTSSLLYNFNLSNTPLIFNAGVATLSVNSKNLLTDEEDSAALKITYTHIHHNNYAVKIEIETHCNHEDILYAKTFTQTDKFDNYNYASAYTSVYHTATKEALPIYRSNNNLFYMTSDINVTYDPYSRQLIALGQVNIYNNNTPIKNNRPQDNPAYRFIINEALSLGQEQTPQLFACSNDPINNMSLSINYSRLNANSYSQDITVNVFSVEDPETCNATVNNETELPVYDRLKHTSTITPKLNAQHAFYYTPSSNDDDSPSTDKAPKLNNGTEFSYFH